MLTIKPQSFGDWLKQRREERDLTQWALSEQAGCSFSTICKLEAGRRVPSRKMTISLMKVFGMPEEELPALLDLARSRIDLNRAGTRSTRSPSYAARRATLARLAGESGHDEKVRLPAPRTPLIGREQEVLTLRNLLRDRAVRIITLLGPPGIGKTRLGLQVAHSTSGQFPDGAAFAYLAPLTDHKMVIPEVVKALGLSRTPGLSALNILKAGLIDKRLLLVLDNFEQVSEAGADVGDLLEACPGLKLVVTSRTALDIDGEYLFPVQALAVPAAGAEITPTAALEYAAIALFEERSRAANSIFRLTDENVPTVADICRRLDGLPLAIELAAARTRVLTPTEILSRLGRGFTLLKGGHADLPARQRSLAGAIDWSYDLLDDDEARLFRRMSVFVAAPTVEAINAVFDRAAGECREPRGMSELVTSLAGKSLVHKLESCDDGTRYYMLQTIREYALERLAESGEEYPTKEKHTLYYAGLVYSAEPYLHTGKRDPWIAMIDADYADILDALAWCKAHPEHLETGLHMAWTLQWYWRYRNSFSEGRGWLADLVAAADSAGMPPDSYHRVKALSALGEFSLLFFDYEALISQLGEAVELWRALGDKVEIAHAITCLGIGLAHGNLASTGRALVEEAVGILREANDQSELAYSLMYLANMHELAHEWGEARYLYEEALDLYRILGDSWRGASSLSALGYLALRDGDYTEARRYYGEALTIYRSVNDRWHLASAYRGLGDVELSVGRLHLAGSLYEESLKLYRLHDDRLRTAILYRRLGFVELQKGRYSNAFAYFTRSVDGLLTMGHKPNTILSLAAFAALAVAQGHLACAAQLSPLVEDSRHELAAATSVVGLAIYDSKLAIARQEMGEAAFQAAYAEGRSRNLTEAVEYAKTACAQ